MSLSGVNTGGVGSYIYDDPATEAQPWEEQLQDSLSFASCSHDDKRYVLTGMDV